MGTLRKSSKHGEFTLFFTKDSPFSNFFPCSFTQAASDGVVRNFIAVEQFYMLEKALTFADVSSAEKIMLSFDAKAIKLLGRTVSDFDDTIWDMKKTTIMETALVGKYSSNRYLRRLLFLTTGSILVECSPMDKVWGIGLSIDSPEAVDPSLWKGGNLLGKTMTGVRESLWNDSRFEEDRRVVEQFTRDCPSISHRIFTKGFRASNAGTDEAQCEHLERQVRKVNKQPTIDKYIVDRALADRRHSLPQFKTRQERKRSRSPRKRKYSSSSRSSSSTRSRNPPRCHRKRYRSTSSSRSPTPKRSRRRSSPERRRRSSPRPKRR